MPEGEETFALRLLAPAGPNPTYAVGAAATAPGKIRQAQLSLTVTDRRPGTPAPAPAVTADDVKPKDMWIELTAGQTVNIGALATPQPAGARVLYTVTGPGGPVGAGTPVGPEKRYTLNVDASRNVGFIVKAWIDKNNNNAFDPATEAETERQVLVHVVPYRAQLTELSFKPVTAEEAKFHLVARDDGTPYGPVPWADADKNGVADFARPVAYTMSKLNEEVHLQLDAKISFLGAGAANKFYAVQGEVRGEGIVLHAGAKVDANGLLTVTTSQQTSAKIPNTVARKDYVIDWHVAPSTEALPEDRVPNEPWVFVGTSTNRAYVVAGTPLPDIAGNQKYTLESVLDIGTRNAQGKSDPKQILDAIWADFAADVANPVPSVLRADGTELQYWGPKFRNAPNRTEYHHATGLLKHGDGPCEAWAKLFLRVLRAQGISAERWVPRPDLRRLARKDGWDKEGAFVIKPVPGQGNRNPPVEFSNHAVVRLKDDSAALAPNTIYDPSYGTSWTGADVQASQDQWEETNVVRFLYRYVHPTEGPGPELPPVENVAQTDGQPDRRVEFVKATDPD